MSNAAPHKLKPGALVSCYFPEEESPFNPGPKARPALVYKVLQRTSDKSIWVEVGYASTQGTTATGATLQPYEFEVDPINNVSSNLRKVTRFDAERRTTLPWTQEWFKGPGNALPLRPFGQLSLEDLARAKELAAKFPSRQDSYLDSTRLPIRSESLKG